MGSLHVQGALGHCIVGTSKKGKGGGQKGKGGGALLCHACIRAVSDAQQGEGDRKRGREEKRRKKGIERRRLRRRQRDRITERHTDGGEGQMDI